MRLACKSSVTFATTALLALAASAQSGPATPNVVTIDWNKTVIVSKSTPTLQVVVNPMTRPGSPIHDQTFAALKSLGADYVRYVPWEPYPKLAVAELDPPTSSSTSWNFSLIDPMTKDFLNATDGHTTVMNFSTIPAWMFKTDKPVEYPADPNQVVWNYTQGTELRDPSAQQVADYFARLVSWYTQGGFTDENGKRHDSGYHYRFPVWEVLNEVDFEHQTTPELYTQRYDAIVAAIHKVSPETKFMGLALAQPQSDPRWFTYFLDHAHHAPGTPLDYISYHFYATPLISENINDWQYTFFDQADRFLTNVRYVEEIRKRLSPETKTDLDELGVILPTDDLEIRAGKANPDQIPPLYWNAAGSLYAYLFVNLSKQGIDIIGESQLVGYPSQFPSVSMMDWKNGKPNARYWVLKLIKDNFHSGDTLVKTEFSHWSDIDGQAFETPEGHKLLLLNRHNRPAEVTLPAGVTNYTLSTVDGDTGDNAPRVTQGGGPALTLAPFAVAVLSWK